MVKNIFITFLVIFLCLKKAQVSLNGTKIIMDEKP